MMYRTREQISHHALIYKQILTLCLTPREFGLPKPIRRWIESLVVRARAERHEHPKRGAGRDPHTWSGMGAGGGESCEVRFGFVVGTRKSPREGDCPWIHAVAPDSCAAAALTSGQRIHSINHSPVSGMRAAQVSSCARARVRALSQRMSLTHARAHTG